MPLYETRHINSRCILAVWRIKEDVDELYEKVHLSEKDRELYETFSSERRQKEWLASRLLTQMMLEEKVSIVYESTGKPYIENSEWEVSITHKNEFVAVVLGKKKRVAVDIERLDTRVDKVYEYFMSTKELENLNQYDKNFQLHLCWCAKECLVKLVNSKKLRPLEDMYVYPIRSLKNQFEAEVYENDTILAFTFHYEKLSDDYVVVWTGNRELD